MGLLRVSKIAVPAICAFMFGVASSTGNQAGASCPYVNGFSGPAACGPNSNPAPIPTGMGGSRMKVAACSDTLMQAIASLYSYDDATCHPANSALTGVGPRGLKYLRDGKYAFPPNNRQNISLQSNFEARLYCDSSANVLILAFKGSLPPTQLDQNTIDDWYNTNLLQQLGERPVQYQAAEDVAWLIKKDWNHGDFDELCGPGRPRYVLTGHSKGGGEAQYAAVKNELEAAVFNSAPVNPEAFSDWALIPDPSLISLIMRRIRAIRACDGWVPADVSVYAAYFATGKIHDVRMVNDPLTNYLFPLCGNLPHAPIEWLLNSLTCSSDGHGIETVVSELHACAP